MFKNFYHYNKDFEASVLGACMLEFTAFGRTVGLVKPEYFYQETNKQIYKYLTEMFANNIPIDVLTVVDYICVNKRVYEINNDIVCHYIPFLTKYVVSTAHLEYHCVCLKRMWMEREITTLTSSGIDDTIETRDKIQKLQNSLQYINSSASIKKEWVDFSELLVGLYEHQEKMLLSKGMGITTGFKSLDVENGGFHAGHLIVIGARPSVGKSALMGQMALAMAKSKNKTKVGIISLEMNNNEIAARLSSILTQTDFKIIFRSLFFDERQRDVWYRNIMSHVDIPIYISDKVDVNVTEIKSKAIKLKHEYGIDCLMVDYLQLVSGESSNSKNKTRENEVSAISRGLKLLALEMNIPVIALAQLNRQVTHRTGQNRFPQLSDLRESGSIEQDADVVMFLHSDYMMGVADYMVDENGNSTENKRNLIIRKWRNGKKDLMLDLNFDAPKMMFFEEKYATYNPIENNENIEDNLLGIDNNYNAPF